MKLQNSKSCRSPPKIKLNENFTPEKNVMNTERQFTEKKNFVFIQIISTLIGKMLGDGYYCTM